jgi:hypothetical protein
LDGTKKARLVAMGNFQGELEATYAPVASVSTVRLVIALAAMLQWDLTAFDVSGAYLNAVLKVEEQEYMHAPPGMTIPKGQILKLVRAIYGLKQSGRRWNEMLTKVILSMGYMQSTYDACLFAYFNKKVLIALVAITVDDFLFTSRSAEEKENFYSLLVEKGKFELTRKDMPLDYCGMHIERVVQGYKITQTEYAKQLLADWGKADCLPAPFPQAFELDKKKEDEPSCSVNMREVVGGLQYLANGTRPDIAYTVNRLACIQTDASARHEKCSERVLAYVQGTKQIGITYKFGPAKDADKYLYAYADANYASDASDRKSVSGVLILLNGSPVQWRSKKQDCIALSTMEAELIAASLTAKALKEFSLMLTELGLGPKGPCTLFEDNKAVIDMTKNPITRGAKHIDVRHKYLLQQVAAGDIVVKSVGSRDNLADIFTKALDKVLHTKLRDEMLTVSREGGVSVHSK